MATVPDAAGAVANEFASEASRCAHCRGLTRTERHPTKRFVCASCGAPRVPIAQGGVLPARAGELLHEAAKASQHAFVLAMAAGGALLVAAGLGLVALLALAANGTFGIVVGILSALAAAGTALVMRARAKTRKREADAIDEAWKIVATDVVGARTRVRAAEVAEALGTELPHAEKLLSALSAEGSLATSVAGDAELEYTGSGEEGDADADPLRAVK